MNSRREKYQRKIEYILDRINELPNADFDARYYSDIVFYRLHTSIQAIMDMIAMLCKDFGITVKDDYSNIEELKDRQLFKLDLIEKMQKLNGLRNALVHKYNHIENTLIEQKKDEIVSDLHLIIQNMEKILDGPSESNIDK